VAEILPPSNTAIEMERKLLLYREAGVQEYWIVDPKDKHISIYTFKNGEYTLFNYFCRVRNGTGWHFSLSLTKDPYSLTKFCPNSSIPYSSVIEVSKFRGLVVVGNNPV